MTATSTAGGPANAADHVGAVNGARWCTIAFLLVGVGNYGYALLLTHLLPADAYARFAAGQGLLLAAATVAMVSVPWVLAKSLSRARTQSERADAVRFAVVTSAGGGVVAAAIVAGITTQFAGPMTTTAVAASTMLIYLTRVSSGSLQGAERMGTLAVLNVGEVVLKVAVGLLLVTLAGLSDTGALSAFGVGITPLLLWWPRVPYGTGRPWRSVTVNRDLWRRALGMARLQGLVAVLVAIDTVLVTVLPTDRAQAASYQASVALARVPLFVSTAIAIAFFPALSRRSSGTTLAGSAVRMYVVVALPLAAVMATAPGGLVATVFPVGYTTMSEYLRFTAIAGLAIGGVNLAVMFAQAADDYRCARTQVVGVVGYTLALLAGWRVGGVIGLAIGAACGSAGALALLVHRLRRRRQENILAGTPLVEPLLLAGVLALLRPYPPIWLAAALVIGVRVTVRFLRQRVVPEGPAEGADDRSVTAGATRVCRSMEQPSASARKRVVMSIFDNADNPYYRGGGAAVVDRVARRLSEEYRVTVVTASRRGGTTTRNGVTYRYLPIAWAGPRAGQLLFHALLPFAMRRLTHDLWMESFTPPFSTSFLPLFSRAPVVGIDQARCGETMWRKYHIPFFVIERLGLRCYRHLVVLNAAHRADILRHSPHALVHVVPNGIEPRQIDEDQLGQGEHILFMGRIDLHQKGIDLLLDAYRRSAPPMPLLLAGAGTPAEESKLTTLLGQAGSEVRWLGHVSGPIKHQLLERSAFMVMPSRQEAFGMTALEAMSYGKPVLHFDLPALHWLHDGGSVSVPPFDVDAFGERMSLLASDASSRRRLALLAHRAARNYTWDETTDRYLSLARHLLHSPPPAPVTGVVEPATGNSTNGGASWAPTS